MPLICPAETPRFLFAELTDTDLERIDIHDGRIDDWLQVVGEPALRGRDAYRLAGPTGIRDHDPSDFDFRIWLAWHDASNRIFVAAETLDDEYVNRFDRHGTASCAEHMRCWDSSVRLWIDGDRSGGAFDCRNNTAGPSDREAAQLEVGAQQHYEALPDVHDNGPHVDVGTTYVPIEWPLYPPYSDGAGRTFGLDPVFSVLEFYVTPFDHLDINSPEASRATDLYPGRVIGFDITVYDRDDPVGGTYGFDETPTSSFDISQLPHGIMVGKAQATQGLDQFPASSWAAVKKASASHDSTDTQWGAP